MLVYLFVSLFTLFPAGKQKDVPHYQEFSKYNKELNNVSSDSLKKGINQFLDFVYGPARHNGMIETPKTSQPLEKIIDKLADDLTRAEDESRKTLERLKNILSVYESIPIMKKGHKKAIQYIKEHKDYLPLKSVAYQFTESKDVLLGVAEPLFNVTEESIKKLDFYNPDRIYKNGEIFAYPEHPAFLLSHLSYELLEKGSRKEQNVLRQILADMKSVKDSEGNRVFSKADLELVKVSFQKETWVLLRNGYPMRKDIFLKFLAVRDKLMKKGYVIGISGTTEGKHSSLSHYLGLAFDIKAFAPKGKVVAQVAQKEKRELLVFRSINPDTESDVVKKLLEQEGPFDVLNEYKSHSQFSTGGHFHLTFNEKRDEFRHTKK